MGVGKMQQGFLIVALPRCDIFEVYVKTTISDRCDRDAGSLAASFARDDAQDKKQLKSKDLTSVNPINSLLASAGAVIRFGLFAAAVVFGIAGAHAPARAGEITPDGIAATSTLSMPEVAQASQGSGAKPVEDDVNDPLEPVNRAIFAFNEVFLDYLLGPLSQVYEELLPAVVREGIRNILNNLATPVVLANDVLQGEPQRAMETLGRAVINSTVGMGGLIDVAGELGVKRHSEDFGQTLGVWGVGEMFYVVLPLLGPSNPRDAVGKLLVDGYFDPLGFYFANTDRDVEKWTRTAVKGIDEYSNVRSDLEQVKKTSIDYYAAIRSLYRQKRASEISNGRDLKLPPIPDLGLIEPDIAPPETATTPAKPELPGEGGGSDQISYRLVHPDQVSNPDSPRD
jgi:phospholipid-binding lipoprotein MlaA